MATKLTVPDAGPRYGISFRVDPLVPKQFNATFTLPGDPHWRLGLDMGGKIARYDTGHEAEASAGHRLVAELNRRLHPPKDETHEARRARIAAALEAIDGLDLYDCLQHLDRKATESEREFYDLCPNNEEITPAEGVVVSECEEDGKAWVLAWMLVGDGD